MKSKDFKIRDVIISIATKWMLHLSLFFLILSPTKMKLGQILVCYLTNISNMVLAQYWRLETSSRPFYDLIKMTIGQDLTIFNS